MRLGKLGVLFVLLCSIVSILLPTNVDADGMPFEVYPILPEGQVEDISSYISIKEPGGRVERDIEFVLKNSSDEDIEVGVVVVDAYTSPNGVVQYTESETENSKIVNEEYKMSEYLTLDDEKGIVKLKGNEEKRVKLTLDADELDGTLLGGVTFYLFEEGKEEEQSEGTSFKINTKINMVIGAMVDFGTDELLKLDVGEPFVDPMAAYYVVRLPLTLDSPLLKKINFEYHVEDKKGTKLFENSGDFDFAPYTLSNISLAWEHDEIEKDVPYRLKGILKYEDVDGKEKEIEVDKEFMYTGKKEEGNIFERLAAPTEKGGIWLWVILLVVLGVIAGIVAYVRNKNKRYVLYMNTEAPETINTTNDLFEKIAVYKKSQEVELEEGTKQYLYKKVSKHLYVLDVEGNEENKQSKEGD